MKKSDIENCKRLALQWHQNTDLEEKNKIRNELFSVIRSSVEKWVVNILSDKKIYADPNETISYSWDCFLHALKHYKPDKPIPLPNHFFTYTRFFMLSKAEKIIAGDLLITDKNDFEKEEDSGSRDLDAALAHLEELKTYRSFLPESYTPIFDDALASMLPGNRDRKRDGLIKSPVPYREYHEIKKIMKFTIEFLLTR